MGVVIGAFVASTEEISRRDKEALVKAETERLACYTTHMKEFFRAADLNNDGMLTWEEFKKHLLHQEVQAYFGAMGLDVTQAQILFDLLDMDQSNQVTLDEFLNGC